MAGKQRPITLEYLADVRQFLRDNARAGESIEDVAARLLDAEDAGERMERALEGAARDGAREMDRLAKAVRDIPDATDDMADKARRDFDRLGDDAKDAGREVGDEFKQNLGESLSSGDLEDLVSDTLGGLVASLKGPVGLAAAGVATGALLVFNQVKAQWEKVQAEISATAETFWSSALDDLKGQVGKASIIFNQALATQQEVDRLWRESPDDMKKLVEQAKQLGINANDVVLARAGDEAAIRRVNDALADSEAKTENYLGMTHEAITAHDGIRTAIHEGGAALDLNQAKIDAYNDSLPAVAEAHRLIAQETSDTAANIAMWKENADKAAAAFRAMPTDVDIRLRLYTTGEQGKALVDQYFPYGTVGGTSSAHASKKRVDGNP